MPAASLPVSPELRVYDSILSTVGNTPLVKLNKVASRVACPVYAKVEFFNPGGSVKDRIGLNIITEAEQTGRLTPGGTVVESTSGNTGVGLAIVCALKGYKAVFVMPDKMSNEKIQLLRAFGAKVIITPTAVAPEDPRSYYSVARQIVSETPNAILANQYHNPENPLSHYQTTGPEIWKQTGGKVTDVVIGMGTGGTITGIGKYLKEQNPDVQIVGVDVEGSILLEIWENKGKITPEMIARTYKVEGIGEDFLPSVYDLSVIDHIVRVNDKESFHLTRKLVKDEGIFAGGSSGAALAGALKYAQDLPEDRIVIVILPDSGSRYLSKLFDDTWMRENGFLESDWNEATLREVLSAKRSQDLIVARAKDRMTNVIGTMKKHDISQLPVLGEKEQVIGLVRELDLLNHMLEVNHQHSHEETIDSILQPAPPAFPAHTHIGDAMPAIVEHNVILVKDGDHLIGLLTKIDVLDFIYR
ncbi:MAG: cystathionine beta-synthase [Anaerolineae bacterium]|nr:MAG: cystathionine beta-synthase [Anaerolineae bacterium]